LNEYDRRFVLTVVSHLFSPSPW